MTHFTAAGPPAPDARATPMRRLSPLNPELKTQLTQDLRALQRDLTKPALIEALRLLESPRFDLVTDADVRDVGEYQPIEIAGERYFERAWSRSKEVGAMLGFARLLGAAFVRRDLARLLDLLREGEPETTELATNRCKQDRAAEPWLRPVGTRG